MSSGGSTISHHLPINNAFACCCTAAHGVVKAQVSDHVRRHAADGISLTRKGSTVQICHGPPQKPRSQHPLAGASCRKIADDLCCDLVEDRTEPMLFDFSGCVLWEFVEEQDSARLLESGEVSATQCDEFGVGRRRCIV